jgi:hypothetical protein
LARSKGSDLQRLLVEKEQWVKDRRSWDGKKRVLESQLFAMNKVPARRILTKH